MLTEGPPGMELINWVLLDLDNGTKALSAAIGETFVFHITIEHMFILFYIYIQPQEMSKFMKKISVFVWI